MTNHINRISHYNWLVVIAMLMQCFAYCVSAEPVFRLNRRETSKIDQVKEGTMLYPTCIVRNGNPAAVLSFEGFESNETDHKIVDGTAKYTLTAISTIPNLRIRRQHKSLTCIIKHLIYNGTEKRITLNLDVLYPPTAIGIFNITKQSNVSIEGERIYTANVNDEVIFMCKVHSREYPGNPKPKLTLLVMKQGHNQYSEVDQRQIRSNFPKNEIIFVVRNEEDSGRYLCKAYNSEGSSTAPNNLSIRFEVGELTIAKINISFDRPKVSAGGRVSIKCVIDGKPENTSQFWQMHIKEPSDKILTLTPIPAVLQDVFGDKYRLSGLDETDTEVDHFRKCTGRCTYSLRITSVNLGDEGEYWCGYTGYFLIGRKNTTLTVLAVPEKEFFQVGDNKFIDGSVYQVKVNTFLIVSCISMNANPPSELSWEGSRFSLTHYITVNGTVQHTTTVISSITRNVDRQLKELSCIIEHDAYDEGKKSITLLIDVIYPPPVITLFKVNLDAQQKGTVDGANIYTVHVNTTIVFTCQVDPNSDPGNPLPKLTLLLMKGNSTEYAKVDKRQIISFNVVQGKITYRIQSTQDSGKYKCKAHNLVGTSVASDNMALRLNVIEVGSLGGATIWKNIVYISLVVALPIISLIIGILIWRRNGSRSDTLTNVYSVDPEDNADSEDNEDDDNEDSDENEDDKDTKNADENMTLTETSA